jgi:hypothetical protein
MRRAAALAVASFACGAAATPAAAEDRRPVRPTGLDGPLANERLSDERTLTRYAGAVSLAGVRARPHLRARRVGRLRYLTEDGPFEVYPLLESRVERGRTWVRIRLPMRPNGRTGWVLRENLGKLRAVRTSLLVDRRRLRAVLSRNGRPVWSSRIGIGTPQTPTPSGRFWIRSRLPGLGGSPAYGPFAFGTAAYSVLSDWPGGGVIGIHGTDRPDLIPGRPSHGCIRLPNPAVRRLWKLMPIGTPVRIR